MGCCSSKAARASVHGHALHGKVAEEFVLSETATIKADPGDQRVTSSTEEKLNSRSTRRGTGGSATRDSDAAELSKLFDWCEGDDSFQDMKLICARPKEAATNKSRPPSIRVSMVQRVCLKRADTMPTVKCEDPRISMMHRISLSRSDFHERRDAHQPLVHKRGLLPTTLAQITNKWTGLVALQVQAGAVKHVGGRKENQDALAIVAGDGPHALNIYVVCDGHGKNGHAVANAVMMAMPLLIRGMLADLRVLSDFEVKRIVATAFSTVEAVLAALHIDTELSGCTCSLVLHQGANLIVGHVGDSRVLLGSALDDTDADTADCFVASCLTRDHNLSDEQERARCTAAGARIEPRVGDTDGSDRLWHPNAPFPGLEVSRALGDTMAKPLGCVNEPDYLHVVLRPGIDRHLILASNGVWKVMSGEKALNIVHGKDAEEGALLLLKATMKAWKDNGHACSDNIGIIVVRFTWERDGSARSTFADMSRISGSKAFARGLSRRGTREGPIKPSLPSCAEDTVPEELDPRGPSHPERSSRERPSRHISRAQSASASCFVRGTQGAYKSHLASPSPCHSAHSSDEQHNARPNSGGGSAAVHFDTSPTRPGLPQAPGVHPGAGGERGLIEGIQMADEPGSPRGGAGPERRSGLQQQRSPEALARIKQLKKELKPEICQHFDYVHMQQQKRQQNRKDTTWISSSTDQCRIDEVQQSVDAVRMSSNA